MHKNCVNMSVSIYKSMKTKKVYESRPKTVFSSITSVKY